MIVFFPGMLVLLGACESTNAPPPDDGITLPDRIDPPQPVDATRGEDVVDAAKVVDAPADVKLDADADAGPTGLRAFVSSTTSSGNLGGQLGADTTCKSLATAAGLGGTWVAWLSNNGGGPEAVDRLTSAGPWRLVTGDVVAMTKTALVSGTILHGIDRDENGNLVAASPVWTGTGANGKYLTNDCDKWTTGTNGRVGVTNGTDSTWTSSGVNACNQPRRVYCFQL